MTFCSWRVLSALIAIFVGLVSKNAFAHTQIERSPEMLEEDYPESHGGNFFDKVHNYIPNRLNIFSDDNNNLFDKSHQHLENMEEDKMAFELQKRTAKLVEEPERKRQEFAENVPRNLFRANWEALSNSRRYRRPFARKNFAGRNFKLTFPPGKRPYYYSEPEGSEFLGGPGK